MSLLCIFIPASNISLNRIESTTGSQGRNNFNDGVDLDSLVKINTILLNVARLNPEGV